ncbi:unnamed protein product [Brassicogethes aeneus]|nr:unnamed protein product [Brassicogethes aeneus]
MSETTVISTTPTGTTTAISTTTLPSVSEVMDGLTKEVGAALETTTEKVLETTIPSESFSTTLKTVYEYVTETTTMPVTEPSLSETTATTIKNIIEVSTDASAIPVTTTGVTLSEATTFDSIIETAATTIKSVIETSNDAQASTLRSITEVPTNAIVSQETTFPTISISSLSNNVIMNATESVTEMINTSQAATEIVTSAATEATYHISEATADYTTQPNDVFSKFPLFSETTTEIFYNQPEEFQSKTVWIVLGVFIAMLIIVIIGCVAACKFHKHRKNKCRAYDVTQLKEVSTSTMKSSSQSDDFGSKI